MRFVFFCLSLLSDWNHGNAHVLRGVVFEMRAHMRMLLSDPDSIGRPALGMRPNVSLGAFL